MSYPQPTRQELLDAKAWLEEYHDLYEARELAEALEAAGNPTCDCGRPAAVRIAREPETWLCRPCSDEAIGL